MPMLFNGPESEGGPITNASDSAGIVDTVQVHPSRARMVGGLFAAIGAAVCVLAVAWLTASLRSPAMRIATAGDAPIPATLSRPEPIPTPIPETERRINEALAKPFPAASRRKNNLPRGNRSDRKTLARACGLGFEGSGRRQL